MTHAFDFDDWLDAALAGIPDDDHALDDDADDDKPSRARQRRAAPDVDP